MGWRGVLALVLGLSGLMSGVQAQPWQPGAWRTDWWRNGATLDMDFANNRYMVSLTAPVEYTSLTQFISAVSGTFSRAGASETATGDPFYLGTNQSLVSRASSATHFDSSGVMQSAATNVARPDYDPSTLAYKGILIEPARTNLIPYSEDISGTYKWNKNLTMDFLYNTPAPDGGTAYSISSTLAFAGIWKAVSVTSNASYTYSVFSKNISGLSRVRFGDTSVSTAIGGRTTIDVDLATGLVLTADPGVESYSIQPLPNGWFRISYGFTSSGTTYYVTNINKLEGPSVNAFWGAQLEQGSFPTSYISTSGATASRAADVYTSAYSGTYFDSTGTLRNAPANTPRLDYDPSTTEAKGVLIEEARTNYVSRSESGTDITSGNTNPRSFVTATSVPAPNGSGTMLKCVGGNGGSDICRWLINMAPATTYTVSLFMKLAERPYFRLLAYDRSGYIRSSSVNLQNGTIAGCNTTMPGSESIQSLSNGVYRVAMTFTTSSTDLGYGSYFDIRMVPSASSGCSGDNSAADGVSGVYFWGAQLEQGAFPTSYIPTSGSTVTRAGDAFRINDSGWINPLVGSIYVRGTINSPPVGGSFWPGLFWMSDNGSTTNAAQQYLTSGGSSWIHQVLVGGTAYGINAPYTLGSELTSMISYEAGDLGGAANGTTLAAGNPPSIPVFNRLELGRSRVNRATGYIKRFTYFPTREPDYSLPDYTR